MAASSTNSIPVRVISVITGSGDALAALSWFALSHKSFENSIKSINLTSELLTSNLS